MTPDADDIVPIVLAAGPGSRLWPLTNTRPKPMVPVAGEPILHWCLDSLAEAGLEQAIVVIGHKASTVQSHFQDGDAVGLDVTYVHQDQQVGSAHAVATALTETGVPESGLVVSGDNVVEPHLLEALVDTGPDAVSVTKSQEASRYGVVTLTAGEISQLEEKPVTEDDEALVSTGSYLLGRSTLDALTTLVESGTTDMPGVLGALLDEGHRIQASITTGDWHDAVYPWDLLPMTEHLLSVHGAEVAASTRLDERATVDGAVEIHDGSTLATGATVTGPTSLGRNVRLRPNALVDASLVLDGVKIGAGAVVERSVLAEGVSLGAGAVLGAGHATPRTDGELHEVPDLGAIVGEGATIGPGAVLAPGTIVGEGATVAPGARVSGTIPDGGWVQ